MLTTFSMLYFTSPWQLCSQFVLLNSFPLFTHPSNPLPSGNHRNVFFIYEFVSVLFVHFFLFFRFLIYVKLYGICLTYLTQHNTKATYVVVDGKCHSFLVELYIYIYTYMYVYICHLFFVSMFISGYIGCFHMLVIVIMLQWTLGCIYPFELVFWISLDKYSKVGLLGPSMSLLIAFVLKSILFNVSIAASAFICLFLFSWNTFFYSFTFSLCILWSEVSLLYAAYLWVLFSYPFSHAMFFDWSI